MELAFTNLLIVVAAGFAAPLALGFVPRGAAAVGRARDRHRDRRRARGARLGRGRRPGRGLLDRSGLAFLLFLAGLEIDFERLRGPVLRLTLRRLRALVRIAVGVGLLLKAAGLDRARRCSWRSCCRATSLGVLVPVLKDAGEIGSTFGQLVIAAGTIADFGAVILLSLFFSRRVGRHRLEGPPARRAVRGRRRWWLLAVAGRRALDGDRATTCVRLQDTTAQIRVRGAFVLLVGFAALADQLGLEMILGAFIAGAILSLVDRDQEMTHPDFRRKLEAVGFGVFIPVFFVTSGVKYDLDALTRERVDDAAWCRSSSPRCCSPAACRRCSTAGHPARPAGRRRRSCRPRRCRSSSPRPPSGSTLDVVTPANAAALIAAGLLSVVIFPAVSLVLLRRGGTDGAGQPVGDDRIVAAPGA